MCLYLSPKNKIMLNRVKNKITRKIDRFNDTMINFFEELDNKYTLLTNYIKNYKNSNYNCTSYYRRPSYTNGYYYYTQHSPNTPNDDSSIYSPYDVIEEQPKDTFDNNTSKNHINNLNKHIETNPTDITYIEMSTFTIDSLSPDEGNNTTNKTHNNYSNDSDSDNSWDLIE